MVSFPLWIWCSKNAGYAVIELILQFSVGEPSDTYIIILHKTLTCWGWWNRDKGAANDVLQNND